MEARLKSVSSPKSECDIIKQRDGVEIREDVNKSLGINENIDIWGHVPVLKMEIKLFILSVQCRTISAISSEAVLSI